MFNPFTLDGKQILITGASSGIGRSSAIECSKAGAKLIITGRNQKRLEETFQLMEGSGHKFIEADLSKENEIRNLAEHVQGIDGLVLNAGCNCTKPIQFINTSDFQELLFINLQAPILLLRDLLKKRCFNKAASIVFISSIAASGICASGNSMYSASKGGVSAFMKNAALELSDKGIRCNAILPGLIETSLTKGLTSFTEEQLERNKQLYPLKRYGKPNDVAYAVIYLLSNASEWITGCELLVDGGRSLK